MLFRHSSTALFNLLLATNKPYQLTHKLIFNKLNSLINSFSIYNYSSKMSPAVSKDEGVCSTDSKAEFKNETEELLFVKTTENAFDPFKGSALAAGFDLKSAYDVVIGKRSKALVKTDLKVQVPHGTYGRLAPRSGLALKNSIDIGAGVIDEDYRGEVGVIMFNHGDEDFVVKKGDRIVQLICEKISYPSLRQVDSLETTERGEGGFGSTGVSATKKQKIDEENVEKIEKETGTTV